MKKVYGSPKEALDGLLFDGMTIAAGGFGLCGIPELLIAAIRDAGTKNLVVASNNAGVDDSCGNISPANSNSNSIRKALWPSACARAVRAFRVSIPRPASAP